jgi:hypothetical protein
MTTRQHAVNFVSRQEQARLPDEHLFVIVVSCCRRPSLVAIERSAATLRAGQTYAVPRDELIELVSEVIEARQLLRTSRRRPASRGGESTHGDVIAGL